MANNDNSRRYPRLKGSENWESWLIRTKATLIKEKLTYAIIPMQEPPKKPVIQEPPTNEDVAAQTEYEGNL